jgi:hypothetical protein
MFNAQTAPRKDKTMFGIFAKSIMTAARSETYNHWGPHTKFDTRRHAEVEAHQTARRRD